MGITCKQRFSRVDAAIRGGTTSVVRALLLLRAFLTRRGAPSFRFPLHLLYTADKQENDISSHQRKGGKQTYYAAEGLSSTSCPSISTEVCHHNARAPEGSPRSTRSCSSPRVSRSYPKKYHGIVRLLNRPITPAVLLILGIQAVSSRSYFFVSVLMMPLTDITKSDLSGIWSAVRISSRLAQFTSRQCVMRKP